MLNLGANRGDTVLRGLTEENYNGRSKSSSIDIIYSLECRKKFEGFKVKVKIRTAVSDRFPESVIYVEDISTHSYGTSLIPEKKVNFAGQLHSLGKEQAVKLVDLRLILSRVPEARSL